MSHEGNSFHTFSLAVPSTWKCFTHPIQFFLSSSSFFSYRHILFSLSTSFHSRCFSYRDFTSVLAFCVDVTFLSLGDGFLMGDIDGLILAPPGLPPEPGGRIQVLRFSVPSRSHHPSQLPLPGQQRRSQVGLQGWGTHISEGEEHGVKVQEHPKEDKEDAEAGGAHTNLCNRQGSCVDWALGEAGSWNPRSHHCH